jgi:hexosaminidase
MRSMQFLITKGLAVACTLLALLPAQTRAQTSSQSAHTDAGASLNVMPMPSHVVRGQGCFSIDAGLTVVSHGYTEPRLERARDRFLVTLGRKTGILRWTPAAEKTAEFVVDVQGPSAPTQQVGEDESYHLEVSPTGVRLRASRPSTPDPLDSALTA